MYLHHGLFRWPCGCIEALWSTPSNSACPGLLRKPLEAAIGQLLAPYRPGGLQGGSKQNNDVKCVHFAGCFDGHGGVRMILYRAHLPMDEVHGFYKSH